MITAHHLEVRAGARLLMETSPSGSAAGDKVGLVGRNGAGKTTLTRILAGEALPAAGTVTRTGSVGYLPQDPRTGDPEVLALRPDPVRARARRRRAPAARGRGRDGLATTRRCATAACAATSGPTPSCTPAAGTPPRPRPRQIAASLEHRGPGARASRCARCPAASAGASSWPGSCSPAPRRCCSTSRPTTSTPTRSSGCGSSSRRHKGGLIVISHDVGAARGERQQGAPPRRQPGRDRRLQHGLDGRTSPSARPTRSAASASG